MIVNLPKPGEAVAAPCDGDVEMLQVRGSPSTSVAWRGKLKTCPLYIVKINESPSVMIGGWLP